MSTARDIASGIGAAVAILQVVARLGETARLWVEMMQRAREEGRDLDSSDKAAIKARLDAARAELDRAIDEASQADLPS